MTEAVQRAAVVAEALSWLGCRYHIMGRVKLKRDAAGRITEPGGIDCGTLLVEVFHRAGIIPDIALPQYPHDWHLHRTGERYLGIVLGVCKREITESEAQPGDVVLYRYGHSYSHGGVIVDPGWPRIVHAYYRARMVIADRGDAGELTTVDRRFFSCW